MQIEIFLSFIEKDDHKSIKFVYKTNYLKFEKIISLRKKIPPNGPHGKKIYNFSN